MLTEDQRKLNIQKWVPFFIDLLKKNKVNESVIPLIIGQIIVESGYFDSNAFKFDNNPSGISWNNNYKLRPGATLGRKRPEKEKGNYVHFASFDYAIKDLLRILNFKSNIGRPIDSTNSTEYVNRLINNGYMKESSGYKPGIDSGIKRINKYLDLPELLKKKTFLGINFLIAGLLIYLVYKK